MKNIITVIIFLTTFLQGIAQSVDTVIIRNNIGDIKNFFINSSGGVGTDSIIVRHENKRATISPLQLPISTATQLALDAKQAAGSYLVAADLTPYTTNVKLTDSLNAVRTSLAGKQATLGFTPYNATNPNGYINAVPAQSFASLTGKPTTLSGYGITDNILLTNGNGSALTGIHVGGAAYLTSNFTTSSVTAVNTNLTFAITPNEKYTVTVSGTASKAISATGIKLSIAAPAGATISGMQYGGAALLVTPLVPSLITTINTLGTAFATGIGVTVGFSMTLTIVNSGTAGNVTLQAATVTSNVATIFSGSSMVWTKAIGL